MAERTLTSFTLATTTSFSMLLLPAPAGLRADKQQVLHLLRGAPHAHVEPTAGDHTLLRKAAGPSQRSPHAWVYVADGTVYVMQTAVSASSISRMHSGMADLVMLYNGPALSRYVG